jgi:hypothetical protein
MRKRRGINCERALDTALVCIFSVNMFGISEAFFMVILWGVCCMPFGLTGVCINYSWLNLCYWLIRHHVMCKISFPLERIFLSYSIELRG